MSSTLLLLPFVASSILLLLLLIAGPSPSNSQMASGIAAPAAVSRSPARRLLGVKNVSHAVTPARKIAPAMPARNRWAAVVSRAHQQQKARSRVAAAGPIRPRAPIVQASPPAAAAANGNMIKQCACEDIRPCKERYLQSLNPCLEACQDRLATLGGNVKRVRQCFEQKRQILKYAISCTENSYKNSCAARRLPVQMIPKRYGREDTLKAYIDTEIRQMVARMGLQREAKPLIQAGEQLFACAKRCMTQKSASCEKQLKCGLSLPAEKELVQTSKQCAIQGGLTTANMQELCRCSAAAGVKSLAGNVCSRIIIS